MGEAKKAAFLAKTGSTKTELIKDVNDKAVNRTRSYSEDGDASNRSVLVFGVGNGVHNQLMSFVNGMVVAILYQESFDVVFPTMWGSMGKVSENRSQPMHFGELYDASHFADCIMESTRLHILHELPTGFVKKRLNLSGVTGRKVNGGEVNANVFRQALLEAAATGVAVDIGRFYARWWYSPSDSKSFESRRKVFRCLKPATNIGKVVSKAVQEIRLRYPSGYTAIHPRIEDDWHAHCEKHKNLEGCWVDEREWALRLVGRNTSSDSVLYVFGGARVNRSVFQEQNFTVITKNSLVSREEFSAFPYTSSLAVMDFFIALEADMMHGFMLSSMDVMIFEARLYRCLPMEGIHVNLGNDWIKSASRITRSFFFYGLDDMLHNFKIASDNDCGLDR